MHRMALGLAKGFSTDGRDNKFGYPIHHHLVLETNLAKRHYRIILRLLLEYILLQINAVYIPSVFNCPNLWRSTLASSDPSSVIVGRGRLVIATTATSI